MMHGKAIWKPGIGEITKAPMGIAPEPYKGAVCSIPYEPQTARSQHADVHWIIAYGHKTQSSYKKRVVLKLSAFCFFFTWLLYQFHIAYTAASMWHPKHGSVFRRQGFKL